MANFYISDLHIGHENILRFDNRPFADVNEMNNKLIENWNARVRSDDTVYILGDFIWAKESEWPSIVGSLAGNKVLIRGNHDPKQFSAATRRMFQEITDLKEIKDSGKHVVMCHYPIPFFRAGFAPTAFMLYGHVHQTIEYEYIAKLRREVKANATGYGTPNGNFINVGCMMPYMDYTPRTLDEIIEGDARYHEENPDAGNHRHARFPPKLQRAFAARHGIVVGERERRHAAERSKLYKLLKRRGAVRISCVAVQVNRHWFSPFAAFPADASAASRL